MIRIEDPEEWEKHKRSARVFRWFIAGLILLNVANVLHHLATH